MFKFESRSNLMKCFINQLLEKLSYQIFNTQSFCLFESYLFCGRRNFMLSFLYKMSACDILTCCVYCVIIHLYCRCVFRPRTSNSSSYILTHASQILQIILKKLLHQVLYVSCIRHINSRLSLVLLNQNFLLFILINFVLEIISMFKFV